MLYCENHFEAEFLKIEKTAKFIGIPFFSIMSILFITKFPSEFNLEHLFYHFICATVAVVGIWFSVRWICYYLRRNCRFKFGIRLLIQILLTSAIAVSIILLEKFIWSEYLFSKTEHYIYMKDFDLKNLLLTSILLAFLINTIYESFYLFQRLSESALEIERFKKENIEAQYQNLTSRLNPHFLFNSLNTLTTIVEEDSGKAVEYIKELSVVYRYVLNTQKTTWTDLPSELQFTNSYVNLLKMRFEDNLKIIIDICDKHKTYYILPMTIQLLIENAVKHNEISSSHPLEIKVFCENEFLIVENNKQKRNIMPSSTKVGLQNISERYRFLVNKAVVINAGETTFSVKIPLIKLSVEELNAAKVKNETLMDV